MAFVYGTAVVVKVSPGGWPIVMTVVKSYTLPLTSVGAVAMVPPLWLVTVEMAL
jgi:hypothetical protein